MLGSHCVNCGINVTSINATNEIISVGTAALALLMLVPAVMTIKQALGL